MSRTCGEALMRLLEAYGVTTVFGIPGEHSLELYRGIQAGGLRAITPRNEQGASLMADGYARASGKPGVCILAGGSGVTNAVTGIGQANADSIPMLVISSACQGPSPRRPWERRSENLDLCEITRPITALSETVLDPEELPGLIAQAIDIFRTQRPRPVHIAIPPELLEERVSEDWQATPGRGRPDPAAFEISAAADLLAGAASTLIIAGGGAQDAAAEITALAERLNAGVVMTGAGKGVVSDRSPLSLGGGMASPIVQQYLAKLEVLLAIGTELTEFQYFASGLHFDGQLVRIDIDPAHIREPLPASIEVLGDARSACQQLLATLDGREIVTSTQDAVAGLIAVRSRQSLDYSELENRHITLLNALRSLLADDAMLFGDKTQLVYTGTSAMKTFLPRSWFFPASFGTIGCALPGAIGGKVAFADRQTVALVGDGGFMFTVNELATAVEEELCIPIIVWDNHAFASIRDGMLRRGFDAIGVSPHAPDFTQLASAFGCPGTRARSLTDFQQAVRGALAHRGPSLIIVEETDDWLQ
ncbi:MAG TPA: 5-guanidino-2-oxopentanoate decarboxylase [Gammaproteobacteria bacterium]